MATDNYGSFQPVGTVEDTDIIPCQKADQNRKSTAAELITYITSALRTGTWGGTFSGAATGTFNGDVTADVLYLGPGDEMTASGTVPDGSYVNLNHATVAIAASVVPVAGRILIVTQKDAGTVGHTLTTAGTFDGTNNTATFNAQYETLVLLAIDTTRWVIIGNFGSVGLSAV